MTAPHFEHTTITCNNRQTLSARVFTPTSPIKGAVMIAPATGIKQQFYANFATYLKKAKPVYKVGVSKTCLRYLSICKGYFLIRNII